MPDSLLCVEQLSLKLGQHCVLDAINLHLNSGELCAIIGPNGAGKSSLLRCISGEIAVSSRIYFQQTEIKEWSPELRARQLAVLPQHSVLAFPYTVREVVTLGRYPHASGFGKDVAIVDEALDAMDMTHQADMFYTELSGGEKQRCQLARVLAQIWPGDGPNSLLLLDEPCSALDPGHALMLFRLLENFCARGLSVIFIVHDVNIASRYAKRIIALKQGRTVIDGSPEAVFKEDVLNPLYDTTGKVFSHPVDRYPVYL